MATLRNIRRRLLSETNGNWGQQAFDVIIAAIPGYQALINRGWKINCEFGLHHEDTDTWISWIFHGDRDWRDALFRPATAAAWEAGVRPKTMRGAIWRGSILNRMAFGLQRALTGPRHDSIGETTNRSPRSM